MVWKGDACLGHHMCESWYCLSEKHIFFQTFWAWCKERDYQQLLHIGILTNCKLRIQSYLTKRDLLRVLQRGRRVLSLRYRVLFIKKELFSRAWWWGGDDHQWLWIFPWHTVKLKVQSWFKKKISTKGDTVGPQRMYLYHRSRVSDLILSLGLPVGFLPVLWLSPTFGYRMHPRMQCMCAWCSAPIQYSILH